MCIKAKLLVANAAEHSTELDWSAGRVASAGYSVASPMLLTESWRRGSRLQEDLLMHVPHMSDWMA